MAEFRFQVPGMTCDHCVGAVRQEVGEVPGVLTVEVDLATKNVVVTTDDRALAADDLAAAVVEAGFEAAGL